MEQDESKTKTNIEAYSTYEQERRIELQTENPDLENIDIDKMICAEWDALCDEKNESYIDRAEVISKKITDEKKIYDAQNLQRGEEIDNN